jgi:hypothetical protein
MRGDDEAEDFGERLSVKAVVAAFALLYAAALAVGMLDGVSLERLRGGKAVAAGERRLAAVMGSPVSGLCFRGPGGEPIDFPAEQHCPRPGAQAPY